MREAGTLIDFARRYWVMPIGFRKSSRSTSPGGTGSISRIASPLVIVDDLHFVSVTRKATEADAPLVIDSNAVLTGPVALQRLKPIARRDAQEIQGGRGMDLQQLPVRNPLYVRWKAPAMLASEEFLRLSIGETLDHQPIAPTIRP